MSAVFGPIPSRRLGKSLGVDLVPLKTCNWNCVYCQLGRTRPMLNTRREYIPRQEIFAEVEQVLASRLPGEIDWVTFVGSGEPTLHSSLGWLIRQVKALTDLPIAVITNGALLGQPDVRAELFAADAVLPSLDAGSAALYRKINRPWPKLTFDAHLDGLIAFRQEFGGKSWVEVMLIQGVNDSNEALGDLAVALAQIHPDRIDLMLPVRPPAESWVLPADEIGLHRACQLLEAVAPVSTPNTIPVTAAALGLEDLAAAILDVVTRHPMREGELCAVLSKWPADEVRHMLDALLAAGKVQGIERLGQRFWSAAESFYAAR